MYYRKMITVHILYQLSLDSRPRRERRPGILCMRMREIIDNNFIIQIVKKRTKLQKGIYNYDNVTTMAAFRVMISAYTHGLLWFVPSSPHLILFMANSLHNYKC